MEVESEATKVLERPTLNYSSVVSDADYQSNFKPGESDSQVPAEFGNVTLHDGNIVYEDEDLPGDISKKGVAGPEEFEGVNPPYDNDPVTRDSQGRITAQDTKWGKQEFYYTSDDRDAPLSSFVVSNGNGTFKYDRQPDGTYESISPTGEVSTYKNVQAIQTSGSTAVTVKFVDKDGSALTRHADGSTWKDDTQGRRIRDYDAVNQTETLYQYGGEDPMFANKITTVDLATGKPIKEESPVYTPPRTGGNSFPVM